MGTDGDLGTGEIWRKDVLRERIMPMFKLCSGEEGGG